MKRCRLAASCLCWCGALALLVGIVFSYVQNQTSSHCTFSDISGFCWNMADKSFLRDSNPNVLALYLFDCDLSQFTADDFARFQLLTELHIHNCTLPPADHRLLAKLPKLNELEVTNAGAFAAGELGALAADAEQLRSFTVQRSGLRRVDAALVADLSHLRALHLSHNDIARVDADALAGLRALRELRLEHNQLRERAALEGVRAALWLAGNPLCAQTPAGDAFLEAACSLAGRKPTPPEEEEQQLEDATTATGPREEDDDDLLARPRGPVRAGPAEGQPQWAVIASVVFAALALVLAVAHAVQYVRRKNRRAPGQGDPNSSHASSSEEWRLKDIRTAGEPSPGEHPE